MAEIVWETDPSPSSLRRAVRHQARCLERPFRVVAENFLAIDSRIDLLGVGHEGELVSLRIGQREDDDARLLTRCLSDLVWLRERAEDLRKLVPDLGIETSAPPRTILVCPDFGLETRRAAEMLPIGAAELIRYRCYRRRGQLEVVFDDPERSAATGSEPTQGPIPSEPPPSDRSHDAPHTRPVAPSGFRTGLIDAQLRLDPVEPADRD